jgi:hypothetical protein
MTLKIMVIDKDKVIYKKNLICKMNYKKKLRENNLKEFLIKLNKIKLKYNNKFKINLYFKMTMRNNNYKKLYLKHKI